MRIHPHAHAKRSRFARARGVQGSGGIINRITDRSSRMVKRTSMGWFLNCNTLKGSPMVSQKVAMGLSDKTNKMRAQINGVHKGEIELTPSS